MKAAMHATAIEPRQLSVDKSRHHELLDEQMTRVLRSRSVTIALVYPAYFFYDWLFWSTFPSTRGLPSVPLILVRVLSSSALLLIALLLASRRTHPLSTTTLRIVNLGLIFIPAIAAFCCVFFAPSNSTDYMFSLALFQIWAGYSTLHLPTKENAIWQILATIVIFSGELTATDFDGLNQLVRPEWRATDNVSSGVTRSFVALYLVFAHLMGLQYNRNTRKRLNEFAKQHALSERALVESERSLRECQALLESVFPPRVFEKLQESQQATSNTLTACEAFEDCTFLFAKIVGLSKLTSDAQVEPARVVKILQLVFDRFDSLADLFCVQKVRKTVYESYMLAAGLPDRELLEGKAPRARAVVSLASAMVAVMEFINLELPRHGVPASYRLDVQIGIHTGSAIAGIMGHRRYQYDLCGDDVNVAARMMGGSAPGCINVSDPMYALIRDDFQAIDRGERFVKGKGMMRQYFVTGSKHQKAASDVVRAQQAAAEQAAAEQAALAQLATVAAPATAVAASL